MIEESYRPRRDDHLVEPMLAGLGIEERPEERRLRTALGRWLGALGRALRRSGERRHAR